MSVTVRAALPATWDTVAGQTAAVRILTTALARDEVAHAWVMLGPAGVGQREIARALGAALNCPESDDPSTGCGVCSTCTRISRGTHPAVRDFEPEGVFHVVDAVRGEWIPTATRTLTEGRRKVLRIAGADRMNEPTQNAFLKILEEPPPSVVWVLDAEDESLLLDTILSRCRRLDLVPWTPDALHGLAERLGIDTEAREGLVRAAMGSPDRLHDLSDPDVAGARDDHLGLVARLAVEGPGSVVPIVKERVAWAKARTRVSRERHEEEFERLEAAYGVEGGKGWPPGVKQRLTKRFERLERGEQRRALDLLLDDLGSYLRDLLAVRSGAGAGTIVNVDHLEALRADADRLSAPALLAGLAAIAECREALERNGQPELQLERLLLRVAVHLYTA